MQHIGVEITDERNKVLEESDINFANVIGGALYRIQGDWESKYPMLSSVDPYGNTVFNILQRPFVIEELKKLKEEMLDEKIPKKEFRTNYPGVVTEDIWLRDLEKSLKFFEKLGVHQYLKFIGD